MIHFTIIKKWANPPANIKPDNLRDLRILSNLRKDPSIIITKADKSSSLVVMDTKDYDTKIYAHLNDKTTYKTITHDHTDQFANKIIKELKDLKQNGKITPQSYNKFFPLGAFVQNFMVYQNYISKTFL